MFRRKSIDEWALDYWLLQRYAKLAFRIFYRKISVTGLQNIPLNEPVILAPNHQNALMDAMVLVCAGEFQNVFLARADIFKGKLIIRFLTYLNIMPIYRIRDGIDNVKRNDQVFEKTIQVLRNRKNPLVLFPEGNHGDRRRLRNLVKGLFRIAFMAQEDYKDQPGVKIIPVGIDYGHYQNFRSTLFVNVGKPIEVGSYYNLYNENPVSGINSLKEDFASVLRKLMIDIQPEEYYELYMNLRKICNEWMRKTLGIQGNSLSDRFRADKIMIQMLDESLRSNPERIRQLDAVVSDYQSGLNKLNLRDWVLRKEKYPGFQLAAGVTCSVILLPVFLFGFINNYIPYAFTGSRTRGIKDPQFHSSFKYVIGMIAFPVMYIVIAVIIALLGWPLWVKIAYIVLMPFAGIFSFHYTLYLKKLRAKIRYSLMVKKGNRKILELKKYRRSVFDQMGAITGSQTES
ncbi:MAG: 1-acyl-sn-glycerol-3-phosphate acyltransferase [Bacteroidales bacterium]|nr:1-acyl-sn-glycerol-3-phosphate acyltransferase [Bacteroidales bacterium]